MIGKSIIHWGENIKGTYRICRGKGSCRNAEWRAKCLILKKIMERLLWAQPIPKHSTKGCCEKDKCIPETFFSLSITWKASVCVLLACSSRADFGLCFPRRTWSKGENPEPSGQNNVQGNWKDGGCAEHTKENTTVFRRVKSCWREERNV